MKLCRVIKPWWRTLASLAAAATAVSATALTNPAGEQVFYRVANEDIPPPDNWQTHAPVHRHTP